MPQDPHLRQRNFALLFIFIALAILLYGIAFIRVNGGQGT